MTNTLNEVQLAQIVGAVLKALQTQGAASKDAAPVARVGNSLEQKDKALVNGFRRKGIPLDQIKLMDRNDKSKPFTIKPFKAWMEQGRMVRKGERGVRGLFHVSQTDVIAPAKPAPKAKGKLTPVKSQLPLV
jgi:hypothetical protein